LRTEAHPVDVVSAFRRTVMVRLKPDTTYKPTASSALIVAVAATALLFGGCRQDMHDQPRFDPMREAPFFSDARSARPLVEGTVDNPSGDFSGGSSSDFEAALGDDVKGPEPISEAGGITLSFVLAIAVFVAVLGALGFLARRVVNRRGFGQPNHS